MIGQSGTDTTFACIRRAEPCFWANPSASGGILGDPLGSAVEDAEDPASTCRMGSGPDAVLDPDFKVRGLDGLYVVDGSAMPRLISAHPNVVIMMMAARAASLWRRGGQPS